MDRNGNVIHYGYYVSGNPVNLIDPYGLSEQDVQNILDTYYQTVESMNESGARHPNPYWNNLSSSFGSGYLGCDDQAYVVQSSLELLPTDDDWNYEIVPGTTWATICFGKYCSHWQLQATSSNPKDPTLSLDPWYGTDNILE